MNEKRKTERGTGVDAKRVAERLKGFNYEISNTWQELRKRFSSGVTHSELKSVAQVLCCYTKLKLDRDAQRDNRVLIKWFDENWETLKDYINKISLKDENERSINLEREHIETMIK